jgi:hypothetical protein
MKSSSLRLTVSEIKMMALKRSRQFTKIPTRRACLSKMGRGAVWIRLIGIFSAKSYEGAAFSGEAQPLTVIIAAATI